MATLRLPRTVVERLREELVRPDEQERFAFVHCGEQDSMLLAGDVHPVPDSAMARQSRTACRPAPEREREHVQTCQEEQLAPLFVHSHPFAVDPQFSAMDVESMDRFQEWLGGLFPDASFGFAVVGRTGVETVGCLSGGGFESLSVEVVGEWKLDESVPGASSRFAVQDGRTAMDSTGSADRAGVSPDGGMPREETADESGANGSDSAGTAPDEGRAGRFDRNVRALGERGQARLQDVTVGVVGVGGLGSMVAEQLVRLGVEDVVLVDPDVVEESNLPRLIGAYNHHVGKPKVEVVREHLWRSAPRDVSVESHAERVQACTEVLDRCDVVVGCVDSVTARSFCNEYAVKHLQYYLDAGVRIDTDIEADEQAVRRAGYIHLVAPGSTACFDCLGRHDQDAARLERLSPVERERQRERGYVDDELSPEPAVVHLNGICASKTVSVLVELVTGGSPPDFLRYEDQVHELTELVTDPSESCPTCGDDGVLGVGRRSFGDTRFVPEAESTVSD